MCFQNGAEERAQYFSHYEHFVADPDLLREKLKKLNHLHGYGQLAIWDEQITAGDWKGFTESILEIHYDPAYERSRKKLFRPQVATIKSSIVSEAGVEAAAHAVAEAGNSIEDWE